MGEHAIARIARLRPFGIDRQRVKGEWLACVDREATVHMKSPSQRLRG